MCACNPLGLSFCPFYRPCVFNSVEKSGYIFEYLWSSIETFITFNFSGRMSVKVITKQARNEMNRDERRNRAVQIRQNKRSEVLGKKRFLTGSANTTPFLTAIVPLAQNIDPNGILELLKQADEESVIKRSSEGNIHIRYVYEYIKFLRERWKHFF